MQIKNKHLTIKLVVNVTNISKSIDKSGNGNLIGLNIEQKGKSILLTYSSNEDGKEIIGLAKSKNGIDFEMSKNERNFYEIKKTDKKYEKIIQPRKDFFDRDEIEIEGTVKISNGTLVVYHNKDNDDKFKVGITLLKQKKIDWRCEVPLWESSDSWANKEIIFVGLAYLNGQIIGYWNVDKKEIYAVIYPSFKLRTKEVAKKLDLTLNKPQENPIIKPKQENAWEAFTTFNPAAIYENGNVHILYRAQGFDYISVIGYASSKDGINIEKKLDKPIYIPKEPFEWSQTNNPNEISDQYVSGGGYGGIEDPRITKIDNRIYMTYVAFNGIDPPRVALTSIKVDDFLNHRWMWEKAVLISPPGIVDKSAVIFPEKIRGKYVIMHRIFPNILIDFVDDLNFDGTRWLEGKYKITPRQNMWDSRKIGAGAPPIKTKDGWLLIYQSVDDRDSSKYLVGAMLLDLNDPTKVLHRSKMPIIRPIEDYENNGFKAGVVYPCGAVVIDGTLFVYYGGADSYVCVATANLNEFLEQLQFSETPVTEPAIIRKVF